MGDKSGLPERRPCRRVNGPGGVLAIVAALLLVALPALATPPPVVAPLENENEAEQPNGSDNGAFGFLSGVSKSGVLLGDMWGLRTLLSRYGLSLGLSETSEVFGNVTGGVRQGFEYDGLTQLVLQLDTQRALGWHGGSFGVSALLIHGRNLSADNLDTLQTASGIEGDRGARLWELWFQQKFLDEDRLDVKLGQQSLDQEFMTSQNAGYFINTMFGWPMVPSADLPGGGPAYPLSALGFRARWRPLNAWTLLAGAFNGSPVANAFGDPQQENASGASFPLNRGVLAIAELQFAYPALGSMVFGGQSPPLPRVVKLGFWYDSERFPDREIATNGVSLAAPASSGTPRPLTGDWSVYAVADQMLWQAPDEADRTLNLFVRAMGTPQEDRNLVDFSLNAGLALHEPILHRDDDTFGIAMGFAHIGTSAAQLDADTANFSHVFFPVRSGETFIEATYQYQVAPWCQVQPDFQYVFNPGAGVLDPHAPGQTIKDEAVFGVRTNILL
ncbi:MAG TPA: carbohydrate porin [Rhizomicrobium sp.]